MTPRLSPRESQILRAICEGRTTKEIAAAFGIADNTVNWHVANTLRKLNAASRAEAVFRAYRAGILDGAGELPVLPVASVHTAIEETRRPRSVLRVADLVTRVALAAALILTLAVGITGAATTLPLFRVAPGSPLAPPTIVAPAPSSPRP